MAEEFTIDLIDGADLETSVEPSGRVVVRGTRVARVKGLKTGALDESKTALTRAEALVAAAHPVGEIYDAAHPTGILTKYRSEGIDQNTGAAHVRLIYDTPQQQSGGDGGGGGTNWTITDDTETVQNQTQVAPNNWEPLTVTFTDPNDANNTITDVATVSFSSTLRTVVLSGYTLTANMDTLRAAENHVNSATFLGLAKGYWKFSKFRDQFPVGATAYFCTIELQSRVDRHWAEFSILRDTHTRKLVTVRANVMAGLKAQAYSYGVIQRVNGAILVGPYDIANFSSVFGTL